ncbi:hypothetical protein N0V85_009011 [Neurospora sp. IMI 360204]|nr:hypothetical protein N0V85_009011 [Neurospora sp. IMI 360204]
MEKPSSEGAMPATDTNEDEEERAQQNRRVGELEVAHAMLHSAQAPSAKTSIRLPLRRSPSPVADQRVSLWEDENRAFKGTIHRDRKRPARRADAARAAQRSALMVNGQPQFVFFCDGSSAYRGRSNPNATQDGGYAVVFRDPYDADKAATASASKSATATFGGSRKEDGITVADFTIRHWLSHRTFGAPHVEIAAIAQALEEVIKRNDQHHPDTSTVKIFTDSDTALARIERGILASETTTAGNSLKRKRKNKAFFEEHTNPFVRLIVWQSHYLSDRGCRIEMNWMPRNTTLGHSLADHMAGKWKNWKGKDPGDAFNQKYLPHAQRDGILDKLHEEVSATERARRYDALGSESEEEPARQPQHPKKRRRIRGATGAKKSSASDYIGLDPGDYIALDSESEEEPEPSALDSESEDEPEPKPQPPKEKQKMEGAIGAQKRSTVDYILLESDSEEEPEPKPQTPKNRKKRRGAIRPNKKAQTQQAGPEAGGFLNGEDHVFNFDPRNLPSYPNHHLYASHDPESGHGTPGCLLCQGDDYPWRSGYTGLPSQWALRRY